MTSAFVSVAFVAALILVRSFPVMSGDAIIAHILKWARAYVSFRPLPTSSMSGSFQCPGPAPVYSFLFASTSRITAAQLAPMSISIRHKFAILGRSIEQFVGVQKGPWSAGLML